MINRGAWMTSSLISCIIPVFNGERYLREAIGRILQQTYHPVEIIVADDGSTDGTASVVAGYDEQVMYLQQPHAGPAAARNLGLSIARGEFVAFLDADDLWHLEKLTRQMARFQARPELDLCITHIQNFWSPELQEEVAHFDQHPLSQPFPGYVAQTLLARRALFNAAGQFNPALQHGGVKDWFLRMAEHGASMELLTEILVYRRLHETNLSHRKAATNREEHLRLVKASLERRRRPGGAAPLSYQFSFPTRPRADDEGAS
jgi:glycosyltransferase involved in cell wall biosynthesis